MEVETDIMFAWHVRLIILSSNCNSCRSGIRFINEAGIEVKDENASLIR